jgi:hypothetical protein
MSLQVSPIPPTDGAALLGLEVGVEVGAVVTVVG